MPPSAWITAAASLVAVLAGVVAAAQSRRNPLARPSALVCLALGVAHGASLANAPLVAHAAGVIAPALALELALAYTGRLRASRQLRVAAWSLTLAAVALARFAPPRVAAVAALASGALCLVAAMRSLTQHLRASAGPDELARTRLLRGAALVGGALGATSALATVTPALPSLGALGSLAGVAIVAVVAVRIAPLEAAPSLRALTHAAGVGVLGAAAGVGIFGVAGGHAGAAVAGVALVAVASFAALRGVVESYAVERERTRQLATIGRFAAQMAHDLKNPLSVLTGAAQFLKEEHARGSSLADYGDFLELMVNELDRVARVVDNYQRLGRVDVRRETVDVTALVRGVLGLQGFATGGRVAVVADLAPDLPTVSLDRDLVENALTNLLRNAFEALPGNGTVTVRAALATPAEGGGVVISVEDDGTGMDARTRERALDSFYTTRPQGSGLGLALVRRVVEAHGGELGLTSVEGRGTVVRVRLPL